MLSNLGPLPSLWPDDPKEAQDFDPFDVRIPGNSVNERLRYLFLKVIVQHRPNEWRRPDCEKTKTLALKCLYASMVGFDKDKLFLLYPSGTLGDTLDDLWLTKAQQTEGPSVRDRCCGHVFEKGETYYRCKQCCADPTVVICSRCFNTQDHNRHAVTMLVGNGSGGCCDCGDPEAFNPGAPRCGIHLISIPDRETPPLSPEIRYSIKETIETAMDFAIDIFSTTPLIKEEINEDTCNETAEWAELNYDIPSPCDEKQYGDWVVVLYNDEVHSYSDVTSQLSRVNPVRYKEPAATAAAHTIDIYGREPIFKHSDLKKVLATAQTMMKIGLFCSVRTERDFLRECLGGYILQWLMDLISIGVSVGGDEMILREIMCQVLARPWRMGIRYPDPRVELKPERPLSDVLLSGPLTSDWTAPTPDSENIEERWIENEYIRLDWILFFDARLWKSMRKCVKSIILGCLLGGKAEVAGSPVDQWGPRNWKRITGIRFARDFAQLCRLWLKYDREGHLSVTKLGVQIFTTPSISLELVEKYNFLTHLLAIEFTYFTAEGHIGRPHHVNQLLSFDGARDQEEPTDFWKPDVRVMEIQEDVHHLLGNESVRRMIPKQRNWLLQFLDFFQLFQGMHAQTREALNHREYESNVWEIAHSITAPITRLMGYIADGFRSATKLELQWAFEVTLSVTFRRCLGLQAEQYPYSDPVRRMKWHRVWGTEVVDFKVAKEPVSLYFPLNWMLALLVSQIVEIDRDQPTDWDSWLPTKNLPLHGETHVPDLPNDMRDVLILACADYPLRANVFSSQIRARLWARNGMVMLRQFYVYNFTYAHSRSCSDFTFLQWAFAVLPPETMLIQMLDRYDLVEQLTNPSANGKHPIYREDNLKSMIEEFFHMLLNLMNERNTALGEQAEYIVRREIAHRLIFKKLPYSDIVRQVRQNTEVDVDDYFDKNLKDMAQFYSPTEAKPGLYELKSEYYSLVDPHHRSYSKNQTNECERVLLNLMAAQGVPEPNRVVEPQARVLKRIPGPFAGLTKVLGTPMFVRVIYCGLRFAVASPSEIVLDQALFLCFIAVMDQDTQHAFVSNAQLPLSSDDSPSLVHALLATLVQPKFTTLYPKIRRLLTRMKGLDPAWFDTVPQISVALSGVEDAIAAAEAEHKKAMAKKRQMEALNRMKLAQSKFQETHKALLDEDSDSDDFEKIEKMEIDDDAPPLQTFQYPHGTCILCQEETDDEKSYGIPAMVHKHPLNRTTPLDDKYFVEEVAMTPTSLDTPHERPFGQANWHGTRNIVDSENNVKSVSEKILGKGFPKQPENQGLTITTCGHLLHYRCWQSYFTSIKTRIYTIPRNPPENVEAGEFLCPLCKSLSNIVIPILWSEGSNRPVSAPVFHDLSVKSSSHWLETFKDSLPQFNEFRAFASLQFRLMASAVSIDRFASNRFNIREFPGTKGLMYKNLLLWFNEHLDLPKPIQMDEDWDIIPILLAGTISSMEAAQRGTGDGIGAELSPPVLGAIPSQDLMLLRVLAKSSRSMLRYHISTDYHAMWQTFYKKHFHRIIQLCPFQGTNVGDGIDLPSLLEQDIFERFVVACEIVPLTFGLTVGNLLLIHYVAEITKIAFAILSSKTAVTFILNDTKWLSTSEAIPVGAHSLLKMFTTTFDVDLSEKLMGGLYYLMERFILPFLRKTVIFVHVYDNVIFPSSDISDEPESGRLCRLLGLPSLDEVLGMDISASNPLFTMVQNWVKWWQKDHPNLEGLRLHHPAIFEVVGLPLRLDILLELASKFRCPGCHLVPDEPALCLLCGDFVCTQAMCCEEDGVGEMNLHRKKCSKSIGVFLWMKRNALIYLRAPPGTSAIIGGEYRDAPYLNVHGESERDLRHGQPQFLSQERYDKAVRAPLLKHAVETGVARRIESVYDSGGWDTL